jgi:hypothetical protein
MQMRYRNALLLATAASFACACVLVATPPVKAQESQIRGVEVVKLEGTYQYISGGVPLLGYITEKLTGGNVKFLVCPTSTLLQVSFNQLTQVDQPCQKKPSSGGTWVAWHYDSGKLIAALTNAQSNIAGFSFSNISVNELPSQYQKLVESSKRGNLAAYSFSGDDGKPALGIITKPEM